MCKNKVILIIIQIKAVSIHLEPSIETDACVSVLCSTYLNHHSNISKYDSTSSIFTSHIKLNIQSKADQPFWICRYLHKRKLLSAEDSISSPAETVCNFVGLETLIYSLI